MRQGLGTLLCTAVFAGFAACSTDPVEREGGKLPDKEAIETTYGMLRSNASADNTVDILLTQGGGFVTRDFYFQQTQPTSTGFSLDVWIDPSLLNDYNAAEEVERTLLPETNYDFPDGKTLDLTAEGQRSAVKRVRISSDGLEAGKYLLPLTVAAQDTPDENKTLYYDITIRQPQPGDNELHDGSDFFFVFYVNTSEYQPLIAQDYLLSKTDMMMNPIWYKTIGNIINLRIVTVTYDAVTGRAKLDLGSDMTYVLDHAVKYIRPLQEVGRKVCISIEGGGTGLGFCNMSDGQIADFTAQVKTVIEQFELDGVNLWDRNAGYGKEGMPAVNTTSYPKLIKTLRETIGSDKLITLTDYEDPTAYFWDTEAMGGIAVGEYLDYAWSGYNSEEEQVQIVDPWHQGAQYVSQHERKPIAGLDAAKYGCINIPWYKGTSDLKDMTHIFNWRNAGYKQSQILVTQDLMTVLQNAYEGSLDLGRPYVCFADDGILSFFDLGIPGLPPMETLGNMYTFDVGRLGQIDGKNVYGKWLKDW